MGERRACRVVRQCRGTQLYLPLRRTDEDPLTQAILTLAGKYGTLRLLAHHGVLAGCGVAGGEGSSAADLATRRAEGSPEPAET